MWWPGFDTARPLVRFPRPSRLNRSLSEAFLAVKWYCTVKHGNELGSKDRWLVFTKTDLLPEDVCKATIDKCVNELNWDGPVFSVSSINKSGTEELCNSIYRYLYESNSESSNEQENRQ